MLSSRSKLIWLKGCNWLLVSCTAALSVGLLGCSKPGYSETFEAIRTKPLVSKPPDERFTHCAVGPYRFVLPNEMTSSVQVKRGLGGPYLHFHDEQRDVMITLVPDPMNEITRRILKSFPDKSSWTFQQLHLATCKACSPPPNHLTEDERRWHEQLVKMRALISIDIQSIEYVRRPDFHGNLVILENNQVYQWSTSDRKWNGTIHLKDRSTEKDDWIRAFCTSFVLDGDPAIFSNLDDAEIKAIVTSDDPMRP
jgi:hypothetical protein